MSNIPQIKLSKSLTECGQSIPQGKCWQVPELPYQGLYWLYCHLQDRIKTGASLSRRLIGVGPTSQIAVSRPSQN
jgi:hypothetical protein